MDVKQLRIRLHEDINSMGEIVYSDSYDLTDRSDIDSLQLLINKIVYLKGFIIEKSYFENGTYDKKYISNEFQTVVEVICAENKGDSFIYDNNIFNKMEYHIIKDSIIDVRDNLNELLINSRYGINDILEYIEEMFINNKKTKKFKK